jgi:hypothetical protein
MQVLSVVIGCVNTLALVDPANTVNKFAFTESGQTSVRLNDFCQLDGYTEKIDQFIYGKASYNQDIKAILLNNVDMLAKRWLYSIIIRRMIKHAPIITATVRLG